MKPEDVVLLHGGKVLIQDQNTVSGSGISDGDVVILVPNGAGGSQIRLAESIKQFRSKETSLVDSLKFTGKGDLIKEIFEKIKESIKSGKIKPESNTIDVLDYFAVHLWTDNILYRSINQDLSKGLNLDKWAPFLDHLLNGMKHFKLYKGLAYRGIRDFR